MSDGDTWDSVGQEQVVRFELIGPRQTGKGLTALDSGTGTDETWVGTGQTKRCRTGPEQTEPKMKPVQKTPGMGPWKTKRGGTKTDGTRGGIVIGGMGVGSGHTVWGCDRNKGNT